MTSSFRWTCRMLAVWLSVSLYLPFCGESQVLAGPAPQSSEQEEAKQEQTKPGPVEANQPDEPQAKPPRIKPAKTKSPKPTPLQSEIETLYVRDKDGELVPVLNMSFEDFERLFQLDRKLAQPQQPPSHSLERLEIVGDVEGKNAKLTVTATVKLMTDGVSRVALRMPTAILTKPPVYTGDGEQVLDSTNPKGGFVSWLRGDAGTTHKIDLKMLVPISVMGGESRISLSLPRASSSELMLTVAGRNTAATIGSNGKLVDTESLGDGRTRHTVAGLQGDFQMAWGKKRRNKEAPLLVEAVGTLRVSVMGPGAVSTMARFRIKSFGREMSSARIRLPANSELSGVADDPAYTVELEPTSRGDNPESPIASVKFAEPTKEIEIRLSVEQTMPLSKKPDESKDKMDVLGFEVLDAIRHSGSVSLVANGDWLVRWDETKGLRRIAAPSESLPAANLIAAFEYHRQPAKLPIRIAPKETHVQVDPIYIIDVESEQVTLDATLNFRVRGAPASFVKVNLAGWEVTDVGERNLIKEDAMLMGEVEPLEIPLESGRRGDFQLRIKAQRPLSIGSIGANAPATPLQLSLPSILQATVTPAIVVVNPDDNLTLSSSPAMSEFDSEPLPEDLSVTPRERPPLCYVYRGDPSSAVLEYDLNQRDQLVMVDITNYVDLKNEQADCEQTMNFMVSYEPVDRIRLRVPSSIANLEKLRISLRMKNAQEEDVDLKTISKNSSGASPVPVGPLLPDQPNNSPAQPLPDPSNPANADANADTNGDSKVNGGSNSELWELMLPQSQLGEINLRITYTPSSQSNESTAGVRSLPFIVPVDGVQRSVKLRATVPSKYVATLPDSETWSSSDNENANANSDADNMLLATAERQPSIIKVNMRRVVSEQDQSIVIERAFCQTWLGSDTRQDRVTYVLSAAKTPIKVQLPLDANAKAAFVLVNGQRIEPEIKDSTLTIKLPPGDRTSVRLEIAYPFVQRPAVGAMDVRMPAIGGSSWMPQVYWQLVTPPNELLLGSSRDFALDNEWKSQGVTWGRAPRLNQLQLEQWSGASTQQIPPDQSNTYLFSGFGKQRSISLRTANRRWLLLAASGIAIALSFLWQWSPRTVRKWGAVPSVILVLTACSMYPNLALILCQAAALGIVLIGLSRVLRWLIPATRYVRTMDSSVVSNHSYSQTALQTTPARPSDSLSLTNPSPE